MSNKLKCFTVIKSRMSNKLKCFYSFKSRMSNKLKCFTVLSQEWVINYLGCKTLEFITHSWLNGVKHLSLQVFKAIFNNILVIKSRMSNKLKCFTPLNQEWVINSSVLQSLSQEWVINSSVFTVLSQEWVINSSVLHP
jgi:hypothetical protein